MWSGLRTRNSFFPKKGGLRVISPFVAGSSPLWAQNCRCFGIKLCHEHHRFLQEKKVEIVKLSECLFSLGYSCQKRQSHEQWQSQQRRKLWDYHYFTCCVFIFKVDPAVSSIIIQRVVPIGWVCSVDCYMRARTNKNQVPAIMRTHKKIAKGSMKPNDARLRAFARIDYR